jgi:glutamyl-Q tRNA(Asp) synthetase
MYRGRFAPSPTGPLHAGSMLAAIASYLDARAHGGTWLIRIEDVDRERCSPQWTQHILQTLSHFGLESDEPVVIQSERSECYEAALTQLQQENRLYRCDCSRKRIEQEGRAGADGWVYSGKCRSRDLQGDEQTALRLRVNDGTFSFDDRAQGHISQNVAQEIGDFVLKRRDGLYAYQLACVVDDALQGITHIVRGCDLLLNTPRQLALQQALGYPTPSTPSYLHAPVLVNSEGQKLSKQTLAAPIEGERKAVLRQVLTWLNQPLPDEHLSLEQQWKAAIKLWDAQRLSRIESVRC